MGPDFVVFLPPLKKSFWSPRFPGHNSISASPSPFWSGGLGELLSNAQTYLLAEQSAISCSIRSPWLLLLLGRVQPCPPGIRRPVGPQNGNEQVDASRVLCTPPQPRNQALDCTQ